MSGSFLYLFRFCCDPGFNDEEEIDSLRLYVDAARVDDVMVFANVEEINTGHSTPEEQEAYLGLMRRVRQAVEPLGVTMSVNHWHTLMHADFGKKMGPGQRFRPMVDPLGREAALCVCPLCENWQAYITEVYERYADLKPATLWIEDDFRLHNHDPLTWGGCFCSEHMELYSAMAGRELTRAEFVAGVLQPGEPHPFRKIWLDTSRGTMVRLAERLGTAVHGRSPGTKLSLMSSDPRVHCAEGRDWHGILNGLACGNPPVNRIHLPCYAEVAPAKYQMRFNMVSMLNRAYIPHNTEVYPELENYPYTRFAKSVAFTRFQLMSAAPLDMSGITIDLFDLDGNGIVWEEGYQTMLADAKDFMTDLTDSGVFRCRPIGVQVMVSPLASYSKHTPEGRHMEELYADDMFFAALLPAFGIPFAYCMDPGVYGQVVTVSGQYLRNLKPVEITALFQNNYVLLNADGAHTLLDMGLGGLAGMESARWARQNGGEYAYEQVCGEKICCGRRHARATAMVVCSDALFVRYRDSPTVLSQFHDSFRQATAPCLVNTGNAAIWPFGRFGETEEPPQGLLNNVRQALLQGVVSEAGPRFATPPMIVGDPYLFPYCYELEDGFALYVVNASTDGHNTIRVDTAGRKDAHITAILPGDRRQLPIPHTAQGNVLELDVSLPAMGCALLFFHQSK